MPFNVCQLSPAAARIFLLAPSRQLKPRIPITERANQALRNRSISLEQAEAHCHLREFELNGNRFQIFPLGKYDNPELTALVVSYLGSCFKDKTVALYFSQDFANSTYVTLKVAPKDVKFSSSLYGPAGFVQELFVFKFDINPHYIKLDKIESYQRDQGCGGRALVALYNIARELVGIKTILFGVYDHNSAAKRFYFHMDFGKPTNSRATEWTVRV